MLVQVPGERLSLVRHHFHFTHFAGKKWEVIVDEDAELFERIVNILDSLLEAFEHAAEAMVLDQEQQLFFRFAVMIKTCQTHARRARNVAHRSRVITLLSKDARRSAQDQL